VKELLSDAGSRMMVPEMVPSIPYVTAGTGSARVLDSFEAVAVETASHRGSSMAAENAISMVLVKAHDRTEAAASVLGTDSETQRGTLAGVMARDRDSEMGPCTSAEVNMHDISAAVTERGTLAEAKERDRSAAETARGTWTSCHAAQIVRSRSSG